MHPLQAGSLPDTGPQDHSKDSEGILDEEPAGQRGGQLIDVLRELLASTEHARPHGALSWCCIALVLMVAALSMLLWDWSGQMALMGEHTSLQSASLRSMQKQAEEKYNTLQQKYDGLQHSQSLDVATIRYERTWAATRWYPDIFSDQDVMTS